MDYRKVSVRLALELHGDLHGDPSLGPTPFRTPGKKGLHSNLR